MPSYIKATLPVLEVFKMAGYFLDRPRVYTDIPRLYLLRICLLHKFWLVLIIVPAPFSQRKNRIWSCTRARVLKHYMVRYEGVIRLYPKVYIWYDIYLLTAVGLTPGGSSTVHIYTQTIHRTTQLIWKSAGCAPSLRVIPWHLPYKWGKSTEKPQSGQEKRPCSQFVLFIQYY
jgi:hypothetical protein